VSVRYDDRFKVPPNTYSLPPSLHPLLQAVVVLRAPSLPPSPAPPPFPLLVGSPSLWCEAADEEVGLLPWPRQQEEWWAAR